MHSSRIQRFVRLAAALSVFIAPSPVFAQTFVAQALSLFNIFVGLMLVGSILLFFGGMIVWYVRLGTWPSFRTEAIKIMEWGVVVLFVLVVLLGIVQFFRDHPAASTYATAVIALLIAARVGFAVMSGGGGEEKKEGGGH